MELKNKRVLVVGLGKSRDMAAALFLKTQGARVTVSDARSAVALIAELPSCWRRGSWWSRGAMGC